MTFFSPISQDGDFAQLQKRMVEIFALLSGILMFFLSFSDLLLGLGWNLVLIKGSFSIPFLIGYLVTRKYGYHSIVLQVLYFIGLTIISVNFYFNAGYRGPTIYTIFIMIVANVVLMQNAARMFWLVLTISLFAALFYGEISGVFVSKNQYSNDLILFQDHIVTIIWTSLFSFLGIFIFIKNYQAQNRLMVRLKNEKQLANEELEELNAKKNQLIALLSHDLKNPIGVLGTTLDLVEQEGLSPTEIQEIFRDLKSQSFHLHKVLNNTLNWVITELDDLEIATSSVSIRELTQEIADTMQVQGSRKNQVIRVIQKGEDRTIPLEVNEIKIILRNLLDNAIKFSPIFTEIDLHVHLDVEVLTWEVRNEGTPIPEELHQDIFQFKVRSSTGTNREKGTGLGLPLCKKIAEKLEMTLGFKTTEEGSVVFFLKRKLIP